MIFTLLYKVISDWLIMASLQADVVKTAFIFLMYGVVGNFICHSFIIGAEDLLVGTKLPSSLVLLNIYASEGVGYLFTMSFLVRNVSFALKYLCYFSLAGSGLVLLYLAKNAFFRMACIGITGIGYAIGLCTAAESSSAYGDIAVSSQCLGFGISRILAPLYYTGKI